MPSRPARAAGLSLQLPEAWEVLDGTADAGVALVAREPEPVGVEAGFRSTLVLTVDRPGMDLASWQRGSDVLMARSLDRYRVVDLEHVLLVGAPGVRRLALHLDASGRPLVLVQWAALVDDVGVTLSGTVEALRYDDLVDAFAATAHSLDEDLP